MRALLGHARVPAHSVCGRSGPPVLCALSWDMPGFLHTEPGAGRGCRFCARSSGLWPGFCTQNLWWGRWLSTTGGAEMADDWPVAGVDDWMALVKQSLPVGDLTELTSTTRDGIEIQPLYTQSPARPAAAASAAASERAERGWDIRTRHLLGSAAGVVGSGAAALAGRVAGSGAGGGDIEALRRGIDDDLVGGTTSLELQVDEGATVDVLSALVAGVDLSETPVALAPHADIGAGPRPSACWRSGAAARWPREARSVSTRWGSGLDPRRDAAVKSPRRRSG